jgi:hypothetical protein
MPVAVIGLSGLGGITLFQADLLTLIEPAVFVREAFMHVVRCVSGIHGYSNHTLVHPEVPEWLEAKAFAEVRGQPVQRRETLETRHTLWNRE